jgi:uncharacterized protein (DUF885 family)
MIHNLGLSEVEADHDRAWKRSRTQVGFKGTLARILRPISAPTSEIPARRASEELRIGYEEIGQARRWTLHSRRNSNRRCPNRRSRFKPGARVPREDTTPAAAYQQGTPDGSRPGIFYFNSYDLPSRTTPGMETLYLHEAAPGHHFQISLAQENEALPNFMRFGGNTAYVEGWALYAETLWKEFGLESDPYSRFGGLDDEMLRAMRLVVDSGLHAKGWTREQAIKYMLDNSSMGETDARVEVERYIAIPGQALAYKIGQLTILRLKAKAKAALGDKFDPREFHEQVLVTGALPMSVLEKKIDVWIAASK